MTPAHVMQVRLTDTDGFRGRVLDAQTGEDLSSRFPLATAHRLLRSFETNRPVRVALFRLNSEGCPFLDRPGHVARELATVLVTAIGA